MTDNQPNMNGGAAKSGLDKIPEAMDVPGDAIIDLVKDLSANTDNTSRPTPSKKKQRKWLWIAIPFAALFVCIAVVGVVAFMYFNNRPKPLAEWGPEHSTPGTSLTLTEVDREQTAYGTGVMYSLAAAGLSTDQTYALSCMNFLDETPVSLGDFRVDTNGHLWEAETGERAGNFRLSKYARGQPFHVALMNADQSIKVFAKVVPFPIEATDGKGCRLSAELSSGSGKTFIIFGQGYEPNEKLATHITPLAQLWVLQDTADATGSFRIIVDQTTADYEIGSTGSGVMHVRVTGRRCDLTVQIQWGPPALQLQ